MLVKLKKLRIILLGILAITSMIIVTWLSVDARAFKIPIFGFHNIIDGQVEQENYLDYTKTDLSKFFTHIVLGNYWVLDTNELDKYFLTKSQPIPSQHIGDKPVMITFDDGYKSMKKYVLPLLEELQLEPKAGETVKVVLFINPKFVKDAESIKSAKAANKYMNCQDIKEGFTKGFFDIQGHGFSHANLTKLDEKELVKELTEGKDILTGCLAGLENTETLATHFAYPYNKSNDRVREYTAKYYRSGYLYNNRTLRLGWWTDSYRLPRLRAFRSDSPEKLIRLAKSTSEIR
ncbi:MAG TPA: polysaccharide deacetylase [Cyanobacteria bacterium UBA11149]|nr:polysaccharide deacetylase [Cyanobacteria bacterium UBA11367]HBE60380.1 polysaccharide deacetylase [Cyanobacteria bacterium UBA11366]HBK65931.1 polysaccharide deacetylase [Cyanobacteria bacterium UBA11166]HBR73242.1 polysaccharide deacetylase [Cyanobacteria bacterium UBA11159]HBS71727.1 polysaccharide deacetylase [Cyanobacteria bacterium UBA11153]HBW87336.1 polysaccharide deacetylase [Cyanobacteria bacterium UBA11149]HCA96229.1 polysaccharide deacetylase [Cyanobacteria bacterium UBA9226]